MVVDVAGAPIARVEIDAVEHDTGSIRETHTRADGSFQLAGLPPGTYDLVASSRGFAPLSRELTLTAGQTAEVVFRLSIASESAEITVIARKIEEDLHDVPASVQVLSSDRLDDLDLTQFSHLQFNVPGLVVNDLGLNGTGFSLRGVGSQLATGLSVAPHLKGVYLGSPNLAGARLFDLERIEVLKGPQGTLYGRNATGGSINLVPRPPRDTFDAGVETAYGTFSTARAHGHVNLPFRNAAARLAFIASESDGYIRNSIDERRFAESDFWGVRGSLRVDVSDALRLDLMAQHLRDDGASGELWTPALGSFANPADIRLATVTLPNPHLITDSDIVSVDLEYDFGLAALHSITGYAQSHVRNLDDCAGMPILRGCIRGVRPLDDRQWSQELRLVLRAPERLTALVGIYYFDADSVRDFHQLIPLLDPASVNDYHSTSREVARAAYGQATLDLSEAWSVTGGLRLSRETHRRTVVGTGAADSPVPVSGETDSSNTSWRLDLSYAATQDVHLYAGVSTGFKSGGLLPTLIAGQLDRFGPESLVAYEVGAKGRWLSGKMTVHAAGFYYDFEDLQVTTVGLEPPVVDVANAARAELYGLDAEVLFHLSERLTVGGGAVWMPKREFVRFDDRDTGAALSGNQLALAPEWTTTAFIRYEQPLRDLGRLTGRLEHSYRSGYFFTRENVPLFAHQAFGLLNVFLELEAPSARWYVFASGRNLTDEDYFRQAFLQSSPGYPDTFEVGAGYRF